MKRPIDQIRDSALSMEVGTPSDQSAITGMVKIGGSLHIVTGTAIYRIRLADEVDPERTNPHVPNSQQKVLSKGSESPLVAKTLLTANELFNATYLPSKIPTETAISFAFECVKHLAAMADHCSLSRSEESEARSLIEVLQISNRSLILPSTQNLDARFKDFVQKADHSLQALFQIAILFYGNQLKGWFEGLAAEVVRSSKADHQYCGFMTEAAVFCKSVRVTRNCIEHPKENERVKVTDYTLTPLNQILPPSITVTHPRFNQPAIGVSDYMTKTTEHIADIFEMMIAFMCSRHVQSLGNFSFQVIEIPEDRRPNKLVRFSYGLDTASQIIPGSVGLI